MFVNIAFLLASCGIAHALPHGNGTKPSPKDLEWRDCTKEFGQGNTTANQKLDCAVLEVPLDYTNPESELLPLDLIRSKATKEPFKGSILYNPGGPGESGIDTIAVGGSDFVQLMGGHFDMIGFDPRGTKRTIPFKCPSAENGASSGIVRRDNITVNLPYSDLYDYMVQEWDNLGKTAELCYEANKKTGRFLSTAFVARDMLQIVDALDEDGLLRYWGVSYGTTLGQTFAAMFPDRIDRMILDSVQLAPDYYDGYSLTSALDSNRALVRGFEECIEIGKAKCPLADYAGSKTTPEGLMAAFAEALQGLLDNASDEQGLDFYSRLKTQVFLMLYFPSKLIYALRLVELALAGNWSGITEYYDVIPAVAAAEAQDDDSLTNLALYGISCIDGAFRANSPDEMYTLVSAMSEKIPFPDINFAPRTCAQWKFTAAERYEGQFRNINTSFPILFINGPYDPITSLSNAYEASIPFKGSRVLVHKGFGHGVTSHVSNCTFNAMREYVEDGTLPEIGASCEPNNNAVLHGLIQANRDSV